MMCQGDLRSVNSSLVSWLTVQELEQNSLEKGIHIKYKQSVKAKGDALPY